MGYNPQESLENTLNTHLSLDSSPHSSAEFLPLTVVSTWMSQEVRTWFVNGLFHLLIKGGILGLQPTNPNH